MATIDVKKCAAFLYEHGWRATYTDKCLMSLRFELKEKEADYICEQLASIEKERKRQRHKAAKKGGRGDGTT